MGPAPSAVPPARPRPRPYTKRAVADTSVSPEVLSSEEKAWLSQYVKHVKGYAGANTGQQVSAEKGSVESGHATDAAAVEMAGECFISTLDVTALLKPTSHTQQRTMLFLRTLSSKRASRERCKQPLHPAVITLPSFSLHDFSSSYQRKINLVPNASTPSPFFLVCTALAFSDGSADAPYSRCR